MIRMNAALACVMLVPVLVPARVVPWWPLAPVDRPKRVVRQPSNPSWRTPGLGSVRKFAHRAQRTYST